MRMSNKWTYLSEQCGMLSYMNADGDTIEVPMPAWITEMVSDCEKEIIFWQMAHEKELTRRQTELMRLLRTSMSADEIADAMDIARQSVFWFQNRMFKKLGVGSREEIVAMFGGKVEEAKDE